MPCPLVSHVCPRKGCFAASGFSLKGGASYGTPTGPVAGRPSPAIQATFFGWQRSLTNRWEGVEQFRGVTKGAACCVPCSGLLSSDIHHLPRIESDCAAKVAFSQYLGTRAQSRSQGGQLGVAFLQGGRSWLGEGFPTTTGSGPITVPTTTGSGPMPVK
jgi:hypothetical protein